MKEQIIKVFDGKERLLIYPYLAEDAPDVYMASAGHVEALYYWTPENEETSGIRINCSYSDPFTREESDKLKAAIDRCWEWLDQENN
jgi:hypothetical protein